MRTLIRTVLVCLIFCLATGGYTLGQQSPDSLIQEYKLSESSIEKAELADRLADHFYGNNKLPEYIDWKKKEYRIQENLNRKVYMARCLYDIGVGFYYLGLFDSIESYGLSMEEIALELENDSLLGKTYLLLGSMEENRGGLEKAIDYEFRALDIFEQNQDTANLAMIHGAIGNLYFRATDYVKSYNFFQKAYEFNEVRRDTNGMSIYLGNMGALLYEPHGIKDLYDLDRSTDYLKKSIDYALQVGNLTQIDQRFGNLAGNFRIRQQFDSALYFINKAFYYSDSLNTTGRIAQFYYTRGIIYLDMGKWEEAEADLLTCVELSKKYKDLKNHRNAVSYLYRIYEEKNDWQLAFEFLNAYKMLDDSSFNLNKNQQLYDLNLKYETAKKEATITAQENELLNKENRLVLISSIFASFVLIGLLLFLLYRFRLEKQRKASEHKFELQRAEARSLRELDQLKSRFFANISHEFRTPLTLIMGPVQQLLKQYDRGEMGQQLKMVYKSSTRLNELVSQLLEIARLESGKLQLSLQLGDQIAFLKGIAHSFSSMAELKEIRYTIDIPDRPLLVLFDPDKLQSILSNLLSNAFKYTKEEGKVALRVEVLQDEQYVKISIQDNGIGIPEAKLSHIFDRFYRVEGSELEGIGIGLALTKELVHLHQGEIEVESTESQGSLFCVTLPIIHHEAAQADTYQRLEESLTHKVPDPQVKSDLGEVISIPGPIDKASLLLVEDNADVRKIVLDQLKGRYRVIVAKHGKEGLDMVGTYMPDLIITDVMMPEMDGYQFTAQVKSQQLSSHIPVIMLTAKGDKESKLEGLEVGADDYLSKPFDLDELMLRIDNLIEQRRKLREKFSTETDLKPSTLSVNSLDETFLKKLMELVEEQMGSENFSIEGLSQEIGISRGHLHKKLKAMTGMSPSVFLRTMRLHRAKNLLKEGAGTAAEISYLTGFSSPSYFSKCFKDQFGISPTELK